MKNVHARFSCFIEQMLKQNTALAWTAAEPATIRRTPLHSARRCLSAFAGNTVVAIEGNRNVIKTAERMIDMGSEGGGECVVG